MTGRPGANEHLGRIPCGPPRWTTSPEGQAEPNRL